MTLALAGEEMSNYQLPIAIFSLIAKVVKKVISCIMWQLLISGLTGTMQKYERGYIFSTLIEAGMIDVSMW